MATYQRARIQLDCRAATLPAAKNLAEQVYLRLEGYRGSTGGVRIHHMFMENDLDLEDGLGGDDRGPRVLQDWMVDARLTLNPGELYAPEKAVVLRLESSTAVGALAGDRIYPTRAPSTAVGSAHITWRRISRVESRVHTT